MSHFIHSKQCFVKDLIESEFFIHKGTLFHTRAPEYERLFLNKFIFGFGMMKFLLDVDLKFNCELFGLLPLSLILNSSFK